MRKPKASKPVTAFPRKALLRINKVPDHSLSRRYAIKLGLSVRQWSYVRYRWRP